MAKIDRTMAKHIAKKRSTLNVRIPDELLAWTKSYAKKRNKTVTQLVVGYLRELREAEVPQI